MVDAGTPGEHAAVTTRRNPSQPQLAPAAVRLFQVNEEINQLLIAHLDPAVWTAKVQGPSKGAVRTIAAIFAHMHNVRSKWIRLSAPQLKVPAQLRRTDCTPDVASASLAESGALCAEMLAGALDGSGCVKAFLRDGWAQPWKAGPEMLCYMVAHEAHHRGQVCMLAHQLGFPLPAKITSRMWSWERLGKQPFPGSSQDR